MPKTTLQIVSLFIWFFLFHETSKFESALSACDVQVRSGEIPDIEQSRESWFRLRALGYLGDLERSKFCMRLQVTMLCNLSESFFFFCSSAFFSYLLPFARYWDEDNQRASRLSFLRQSIDFFQLTLQRLCKSAKELEFLTCLRALARSAGKVTTLLRN